MADTASPVTGIVSYIISLLCTGIYRGNHHYLLYALKKVSSDILLSNLHMLFYLSLEPVAFFHTYTSRALFFLQSTIWFIPDKLVVRRFGMNITTLNNKPGTFSAWKD